MIRPAASTLHLLFVTSASLLLAFATAAPASAEPKDQGPASAIATTRHDLPILLASLLEDTHLKSNVDWVVTDGNDAVAMWHAGKNRGMVVLRLRNHRWWWRAAAVESVETQGLWSPMLAPGHDLGYCGTYGGGPPTARGLLEDGFISEHMATEVSPRLKRPPARTELLIVDCHYDPHQVASTLNGYDALFDFRDDFNEIRFALERHGTAGSQATSKNETPYLFTLQRDPRYRAPATALTFSRGSTFAVWFPYVLPQDRSYFLSLSDVSPQIDTTHGTLRNNTLHFVLPGFTLPPGQVAHGRIDGFPLH